MPPSPFAYTPDLVAILIEKQYDDSDSLDDVDYRVDLAAALDVLKAAYPGAHALAVAYARGHTEDEMAEALGWDRKAMRDALNLVFAALADAMNGEE